MTRVTIRTKDPNANGDICIDRDYGNPIGKAPKIERNIPAGKYRLEHKAPGGQITECLDIYIRGREMGEVVLSPGPCP